MLALGYRISNDNRMTMEGFQGDSALLRIHESFAATTFGETLATEVRYDKYRPEGITKQRWEELLGPDVNNLDHLFDTYQLTGGFIRHSDRLQPGLLSPHDKAILRVASQIHDWGESITTDVNYHDKTVEDELAEQAAFDANLDAFYPANDPEMRALINEAAETVIFDPDSRLGSILNSIERIGYLRTALCADRHAREGSAPDCEENLRWLAAAVLSSDHIETLAIRGQQVYASHDFLVLRENDISAAYEAADNAVFFSHEAIQIADTRGHELDRARLVWKMWCAGINSVAR